MITLVDTIRAVSAMLETLFGDPPVTKDIDEGFDRPCTYVEPLPVNTEVSSSLRMDTCPIRIFRFAEKIETGYLELLQEQEKLLNALSKPIPVTDVFLLYPEDMKFDLSRADMALSVDFTVTNVQELEDEDTGERMQDLTISERTD